MAVFHHFSSSLCVPSVFARRSIIRVLLLTAITMGVVCTIHYNSRLASLRRNHNQLRMRVGFFDVESPERVRVVRTAVPEDLVYPGMEKSLVWRYRVSFPAGYEASYQAGVGLLKADAPCINGSTSTSFGGGNPKSSEMVVAIAFIPNGGQWFLSNKHSGGSSILQLPETFSPESIDDYVVEPLVDFGVTRTFASDEPICFLRVREKELVVTRNGTQSKNLFRGCAVYGFNGTHVDAFAAWQRGEVNSMKEALK